MSEYKSPGRSPGAEIRDICVMGRYCVSSFPFEEEVPETKTETVSTKLSEFPHNTSYHTNMRRTARRYGPHPHS